MLDVDNYATWRTKMMFLLISKGLWGAVTGEQADPEKSAKAFAQIGLHVKDHHLSVLERCSSAKAAWEALAAVFQAKGNARKRQLRKELAQLKMGAAEPLSKYVARAKDIQNQLLGVGQEVPDQEVAWALLAGLPPAYDTVVTVLETSTDVDLKLDDIVPKLQPVEQRMRAADPSHPHETALVSKRGRGGYNGNRGQHRRSDSICYACGERGHFARECPDRRGGQHHSAAQQFSAIAF